MNTSRRAMPERFQMIRSIPVANPCGTYHTTRSSTSTNLVRYKWVLIAQLLQGPNLTNNFTGVLPRVKQEPAALMADVERMFYQVRVVPDGCHALRFLWWEEGDMSKNPVDHQMLVHLFGASSSPCCESFVLKKTTRDFGGDFDAQTLMPSLWIL